MENLVFLGVPILKHIMVYHIGCQSVAKHMLKSHLQVHRWAKKAKTPLLEKNGAGC